MQGKHKALLGNVNKMFMVGHIFDRSVGNLKPTIIFIWPNHMEKALGTLSGIKQAMFLSTQTSDCRGWPGLKNVFVSVCGNRQMVDNF